MDETSGRPVYVVDDDRRQTFVLLSADNFQRVERLLGNSAEKGDWDDAKNARRCELIDKDLEGKIADEERDELTVLERQTAEHFDRVAPPRIIV